MRWNLDLDDSGDVSLRDLARRPLGRVERVSIASFWALVVTLVAARIVYVDPLFEGTRGALASLGHAIGVSLG